MSDQKYGGKPEVPTHRLREAFERSGMTKGQLARELGWTRPNIDKVNRALGLRPDTNSRGGRSKARELTSYPLADRIRQAIGADPIDVDM